MTESDPKASPVLTLEQAAAMTGEEIVGIIGSPSSFEVQTRPRTSEALPGSVEWAEYNARLHAKEDAQRTGEAPPDEVNPTFRRLARNTLSSLNGTNYADCPLVFDNDTCTLQEALMVAYERGRRSEAARPRVSDLVRQAAALMRASKRGEVQAHVKDGDGWIEVTLPEHRPPPEGPGSADAPQPDEMCSCESPRGTYRCLNCANILQRAPVPLGDADPDLLNRLGQELNGVAAVLLMMSERQFTRSTGEKP